MNVGVIADTHNLMRVEALEALQGVDRILHAGDVCCQDILDALSAIAPLSIIRGNCDPSPWAAALPGTLMTEIEGAWIYMVHDLRGMEIDPAAAGVRAVISGHTHQPIVQNRNGVLYVNPGSAGPKRFQLPVSIARMTITNGNVEAKLITLNC